jgi:WhiB family redox-sensing transcriptional regulator
MRADLAVIRLLMETDTGLPDLQAILHRPTWQREAACRGADPQLFFSRDGSTLTKAKSICARCPVVEECEEFSKGHALLKGVWAGKSERARARERANRCGRGRGAL